MKKVLVWLSVLSMLFLFWCSKEMTADECKNTVEATRNSLSECVSLCNIRDSGCNDICFTKLFESKNYNAMCDKWYTICSKGWLVMLDRLICTKMQFILAVEEEKGTFDDM